MNDIEITAQIRSEFKVIAATTLPRLLKQYKKERHKFRIDKARSYQKDYAFKTAGKNTWIIFIEKPPSSKRLTGDYEVSMNIIVYYYNQKGIRVFSETNHGLLTVYNAHFFKRYNERLNLNIAGTLDVVKHFFKNNVLAHHKVINKDGRVYIAGYSRDGLLLGEVINNRWFMWNTFVNKGLLRKDQDEAEIEMLHDLEEELKALVEEGKAEGDHYTIQLDKFISLTNKNQE